MENIMNLSEEERLNIRLCFLCQKRKKNYGKLDKLRNATADGILAVQKAAGEREENGGITITSRRVNLYLNHNSNINISSLKWHKNCYSNFASQSKVDRLLPVVKETVMNENSNIDRCYKGITRSKVNVFN